jgi:ankyrin repeat protein
MCGVCVTPADGMQVHDDMQSQAPLQSYNSWVFKRSCKLVEALIDLVRLQSQRKVLEQEFYNLQMEIAEELKDTSLTPIDILDLFHSTDPLQPFEQLRLSTKYADYAPKVDHVDASYSEKIDTLKLEIYRLNKRDAQLRSWISGSYRKGIDFSIKYASAGTTLLIAAAAAGYSDIVGRVISTGNFDINAQNDAGATALMAAASYGYPAIVQLLIEHRANPLIRDELTCTALEYVCMDAWGDDVVQRKEAIEAMLNKYLQKFPSHSAKSDAEITL